MKSYSDLTSMELADLKEMATELGIPLKKIQAYRKQDLIRKIWEHIVSEDEDDDEVENITE
ncbi:MAG: Rho termination factor N-terminal domain-containing protein, partial [Bacteroidales bacterium]|nr:Rho termination factor N-terminal domain-containing protein [Bacteroidales bacterium]